MEYEILPSLTKDYILSKLTQEQIFEYYLGVKVEIGYLIKSPSVIRNDDNDPSFSFYYSSQGKLKGRDMAGYFWGDCFDIVAFILRVNSNDKKSFAIILDRIARDFRIHKYEGHDRIYSGNVIDNREAIKVREKKIIQFQPRQWNRIDADFWFAGNINRKILSIGEVYPCEYIWINNQLIYNFVPKDPAYAYYFSPNDIKIYFPFRDNYRFISNTSTLQGIKILQPDRIGIVTKSYKDVLSLRTFNISSIAPSSETVPLTTDEWWKCKWTCDHWFSLMDFDRQGLLMARKLRKLYGIQPLFFSQYKPLNKKLKDGKVGIFVGRQLGQNYKSFPLVKDFYDYVKAYGKDNTMKLINETKEIYTNKLDKIDADMYEDLSWIKNTEKMKIHYAHS